jgi:hypothetical protein
MKFLWKGRYISIEYNKEINRSGSITFIRNETDQRFSVYCIDLFNFIDYYIKEKIKEGLSGASIHEVMSAFHILYRRKDSEQSMRDLGL